MTRDFNQRTQDMWLQSERYRCSPKRTLLGLFLANLSKFSSGHPFRNYYGKYLTNINLFKKRTSSIVFDTSYNNKLIKMKVQFILLSLAISSVFSSLDIYEPKQAKAALNGSSFSYTVANFGHIPYGKSIIGNLVVMTPLENCEIASASSIPVYDSTFLLIKRGTCSFVKKVMNAEKLGAKMAIIMDNVPQNSAYLTMKDDGNGYLVNIPSILISDNDGQRLMNLSAAHNPITLKVAFQTFKTQKVNLTIYTQANNRVTYHFVRSFAEYYPSLQKHVNFNVVPHSSACYYCKPSDCIIQGDFCSINYDMRTQVTGKDIVKQQLREQIVSRKYLSKWWDYMDQFDQQCDNLLVAQACSAKILKKLGINADQIEQQLNRQISTKSLLKENAANLEYSGTFYYPSILINNQRYLGNLKASYVFQQVCSTLASPPAECGLGSSESHTSSWLIVFFVILSAFILFSVIFYFYRRHLNKELTLQMSSQVNQQVSKYIEFYSSRQNQ